VAHYTPHPAFTNLKHGMSYTPEYRAWTSMIQRCEYEKCASYHRYGGRGIRVCQRWRESFDSFYADLGARPAKHSLDRIDSNGHYEPGNCKWSTKAEQQRNCRSNVRITVGDRTMCASEWARESGLNRSTIMGRLRRGLPPEQVVSPERRSK
jgi:hypothetical protein